jgi:hypothetical protein
MVIACAVLVAALAIGQWRGQPAAGDAPQKTEEPRENVPYPHIGRIQVLNGCGIDGAGKTVADFLRTKKFDVKNTSGAKTSNYSETLVISRVKNQGVAQQVAHALGIPSVVLIRNGDEMYDVTVYVGADFREHVR